MSRRFEAALIVTSGRLTLSELAARLQREPSSGSHDKGSIRGFPSWGKRWTHTVWRQIASCLDGPLLEQCEQLLADMPPGCAELVRAEPEDISVCLDIACFFQTAYFNLTLPRKFITDLAAKGIDLEITAYPVAPDVGD